MSIIDFLSRLFQWPSDKLVLQSSEILIRSQSNSQIKLGEEGVQIENHRQLSKTITENYQVLTSDSGSILWIDGPGSLIITLPKVSVPGFNLEIIFMSAIAGQVVIDAGPCSRFISPKIQDRVPNRFMVAQPLDIEEGDSIAIKGTIRENIWLVTPNSSDPQALRSQIWNPLSREILDSNVIDDSQAN